MTLDEAIQHGEAIATEYEYEIKEFLAVDDEENAGKCIECRDNHVQLINWLKELKDLRILIGGEDNYLIEPPEQADVQPVNQWISCKDKMPEHGVTVLIYAGNHMIMLAWYDKDMEYFYICDSDYKYNPLDVTHWQPLPEPPKKED